MRIPPWAETRITVVLLICPFVASAIAGVMAKKLLLWFNHNVALSHGDRFIGLPLAALSLITLIALFVRADQVRHGAESRFSLAFRLAPFTALAGTIIGLLANTGR